MAAIGAILWQIIRLIRLVADVFVIICFSYMTIGVLVQVVGRYVFNFSIAGAIETATIAQIWMVLVGAGVTMRRGMHVAVDVVAAMLPLPLARALSLIIAAGCLWFLAVIVHASDPIIELGFIESSPALQIPMWIPYLGLPVGACYFGLEVVIAVVRRWNNPFGLETVEVEADSSS